MLGVDAERINTGKQMCAGISNPFMLNPFKLLKQRLRRLAVGGANGRFHAHDPSALVSFDRFLESACVTVRVFLFQLLNMDAESRLASLVRTVYWLGPPESHTDAHTQAPRLSTTRLWRAINLPFASGQQL